MDVMENLEIWWELNTPQLLLAATSAVVAAASRSRVGQTTDGASAWSARRTLHTSIRSRHANKGKGGLLLLPCTAAS